MVHKTENWQEALLRVRQGLNENKEPVVKTEDEIILEEIDALIGLLEEDNVASEAIEESPIVEEEVVKPVSKLLEKNMLGRLAELSGDKKKEFFDYIDKNWNGEDEAGKDGAKEEVKEGELPPALKKAIAKKKGEDEDSEEDEDKKED